MAQPVKMFQGPAPEAMGRMGEGLSQAGANIGKFMQEGYESLGKGLASGITGAAQAYGGYQTAKASNKITEGVLSSPELSNKFLGIPMDKTGDKMRSDLQDQFKSAIDANGQFGGASFSKQIMGPYMDYAEKGRQFDEIMKRQQEQSRSSLANAMLGAIGQSGGTFRSSSFTGGMSIPSSSFEEPPLPKRGGPSSWDIDVAPIIPGIDPNIGRNPYIPNYGPR